MKTTIDDLEIYASPNTALKLALLHNSKGLEYEAVAIIDANEDKTPFYQARTADEIEEAKRLFYVGVTRAKRYLLYVTDASDRRNSPSRFLQAGAGGGCLLVLDYWRAPPMRPRSRNRLCRLSSGDDPSRKSGMTVPSQR